MGRKLKLKSQNEINKCISNRRQVKTNVTKPSPTASSNKCAAKSTFVRRGCGARFSDVSFYLSSITYALIYLLNKTP